MDWAALAKQWIAQREAVGTADPVQMGGVASVAGAPPPPPPEEEVSQVPEGASQNDMDLCEDEGTENSQGNK